MNKKYNHIVRTMTVPDITDPFAAACAASMHFQVLTTCPTQVRLTTFTLQLDKHDVPTPSNFSLNELFNFNLGSKLKAITVLMTPLTSCRSYVNCKRENNILEHIMLLDDRTTVLS
jgi:hypothetical protein